MEKSGEEIREGVKVLICNQLSDSFQIWELSNSEHNRLSCRIWDTLRRFHYVLMDMGAHGHMFSSALQFKTLNELVVEYVEEVVKQEEVLPDEDPATQTGLFNCWPESYITCWTWEITILTFK